MGTVHVLHPYPLSKNLRKLAQAKREELAERLEARDAGASEKAAAEAAELGEQALRSELFEEQCRLTFAALNRLLDTAAQTHEREARERREKRAARRLRGHSLKGR